MQRRISSSGLHVSFQNVSICHDGEIAHFLCLLMSHVVLSQSNEQHKAMVTYLGLPFNQWLSTRVFVWLRDKGGIPGIKESFRQYLYMNNAYLKRLLL
jgi:hypothetical protein